MSEVSTPSHWARGNIRAFAKMRTGHTPSRQVDAYWENCNIPWFTLADVWQLREGRQLVSETAGLISEVGLANSAAELLPRGTVILSRTASVGFSGILERPMATSQDFWNWVPGPLLRSDFLWYQMQALRPYFLSLMQGSTHKTIYQGDAAQLSIDVPPLGEQSAIAEFLDRETAEIDAFIADQKELIALLDERKIASISSAVDAGAGGIDGSKWTWGRVGGSVRSSQNGVWGDELGVDRGTRVVRVADFDRQAQRVHDRSATDRLLSSLELSKHALQSGDLLLEKSGGGEKSPVGFVILWDRDEVAVCSNFVARLRLREGMSPRFWTYVHRSLYAAGATRRAMNQSTGIQNLDQRAYFAEMVAFPPEQEQNAMADWLDVEVEAIDANIADAREAIALSKERRAALISAAVTGQIDVTEKKRVLV